MKGLVRYDAARKALAAAHRVDEVKDIRDKAVALQAYARQAKDTEMQNWAAEIRLRAERRAGELLTEAKANGQRQRPGDKAPSVGRGARPSKELPTLEDIGVTKDQSSKWQRLAKIEEPAFEKAIQSASAAGELTSAAVLKETTPRQPFKAPPIQISKTAHDIATELTAYFITAFSRLTETNAIKEVRDLPTRIQIETLIRTLRKISKDTAERAERLAALMADIEEAA